MIDYFWYYATTLAFICVVVGLLCVYRYYLGNRLTAQANKLKSQMANIKQYMPELTGKSEDIVSKGLEGIGVSGILDELGIDPSILSNPLVKGLVDKYAPKLLEQLSKQQPKQGSNDEWL